MNFLKKEIISINAAAFLIGAAGFLSRLLGLVRDRLLAGHFGASRELDIYYAAFQIPDFIFTVFLVGSATAAIIPVFLEFNERDHEDARRLIESLFSIFFIFSAIFCAAIAIFAPIIIRILTPGFSPHDQATTVFMTRVMMASPFLLSLSNILSGVIQAHRRFITFSLAPIFYNVGIIIGIVFLVPLFGFIGLAFGVILGAFFHFAVQAPVYYGLGFRVRFLSGVHPGIRRIIALSVPRVLAVSFSSATFLILIAIASMLTPGSISVLQFAKNLQYIPVGILGVSFAVAMFPRLSESFIKKDAQDFYSVFFSTLETVIFWLAPLSALFFVLRAHIVRLVLGAGKFDLSDTRMTAAVLGIFSLTIIFESITPLFIKSFYAVNKTARPLMVNILSALMAVALSFLLVPLFSRPGGYLPGVLGEFLKIDDLHNLGIIGMACAMVIAQAVNFFLLAKFFIDEAKSSLGPVVSNGFSRSIRVIFETAFFAGLVTYIMLRVINIFLRLDSFLGVLIQSGGAGLCGIVTYVLILHFLKNKDLANIIEVFRRRMLKTAVLPSELNGDFESQTRH